MNFNRKDFTPAQKGEDSLRILTQASLGDPNPRTVRLRMEWLMTTPDRVVDELVALRLKFYSVAEGRPALGKRSGMRALSRWVSLPRGRSTAVHIRGGVPCRASTMHFVSWIFICSSPSSASARWAAVSVLAKRRRPCSAPTLDRRGWGAVRSHRFGRSSPWDRQVTKEITHNAKYDD